MERQSKGLRGLEAYCKGGQGPPWAVAPLKKNTYNNNVTIIAVIKVNKNILTYKM